MREWLAALAIVSCFGAGLASAALLAVDGPWWLAALVLGAPALVLRLVFVFARHPKEPHR